MSTLHSIHIICIQIIEINLLSIFYPKEDNLERQQKVREKNKSQRVHDDEWKTVFPSLPCPISTASRAFAFCKY